MQNFDVLGTVFSAVISSLVSWLISFVLSYVVPDIDTFACVAFGTAMGVLGYSCGYRRGVGHSQQTPATKRQKIKNLERCFASLTNRQRGLVTQALNEGSVNLSAHDHDALTLCELGIFGMPPFTGVFEWIDFQIQPDVILEIRKHRSKWLEG